MKLRRNTASHVNTNFKGAFILNIKNKPVKESVPAIIKKGRQIFYDIKKDGDVVLVTKDKYDKYVHEFINNEKLDFIYYPEISTKSGLDDKIPSGLKKLLNIKNNCVINNLEILNKFFDNGKLHLSKQSEYLQEAMNTLRLSIENLKINLTPKGVFVIKDTVKQRKILSSGFKNGEAFICVIPDSKWQETKRYLLSKNGQKIIKEYNSPDEIKEFNNKFMKFI